MYGGVCIVRGFEQMQGHAYNLMLHFYVVGLATGVAKWKVGENEARHATLFDDVAGGADDDGGDAVGFQVTGGQTHGLMTNRSHGKEQDGIDFISATVVKNGRGIFGIGCALAKFGRYAIKTGRKSADYTLFHQFLHSIDRQKAIYITRMRCLFVP